MIYKLFRIVLLIAISLNLVFAQKKTRPDLYLYFQLDSQKRIYKLNEKSEPIIKSSGYDRDIYNYSYITTDGKTQRIYKLFSTINKTNYCIIDSSTFKRYKILPFKNLEKIKGLISYEWNKKTFAYNKVFVVEKIDNNQFKIIQVQLYFPFSSNGYWIETKSDH